jgi:hypothetical protein
MEEQEKNRFDYTKFCKYGSASKAEATEAELNRSQCA